jgi:glutamate carboxypeptidase
MLDAVRDLVSIESPTADLPSIRRVVEHTEAWLAARLGTAPEVVVRDGRPHLRWNPGGDVVLVGHLDTVWPLGTLARWPFSVSEGRATGPGVFDMKAGVVIAAEAVASLADPSRVTLLLNTDEETGSGTSRGLVEETARGCRAALVCEPAHDGAVKTGRKGVGMYGVTVTGRAAHAGLDPENGVNATVELAHQVLAVAALNDPANGTTVTPTVASSGTVGNTVPPSASLYVDVRATSAAALDAVDARLRALAPVLPGAVVTLTGGVNRPPLEPRMSRDLYALAVEAAREAGIDDLRDCTVGGGSDGNFTAGIGVPTLDGLGAVGAGAHSEGEWADVAELPRRAALLAALLRRLTQGVDITK